MDTGVGKILDLLDEMGIADDTLVFFASDNGYSCWGYFGTGYGEGGIRVPMIARWPGSIEPSRTTEQVVAFWDVIPTLAELGETDPTQDTDGISFVPTLLGRPP